jgi:hypothetical protein
MTPGLEVVAHHDAVETDVFGVDAKIQQLDRAELLGGRLVAQPNG